MHVGISARTYDLNGALVFEINPKDLAKIYEVGARRFSVSETLDGGASVYDTGYSDAKAVVRLNAAESSGDIMDFFIYIVRSYTLVIVSLPTGCFTAVPGKKGLKKGKPWIDLSIVSRISA